MSFPQKNFWYTGYPTFSVELFLGGICGIFVGHSSLVDNTL
jgi:hypothetical protein